MQDMAIARNEAYLLLVSSLERFAVRLHRIGSSRLLFRRDFRDGRRFLLTKALRVGGS